MGGENPFSKIDLSSPTATLENIIGKSAVGMSDSAARSRIKETLDTNLEIDPETRAGLQAMLDSTEQLNVGTVNAQLAQIQQGEGIYAGRNRSNALLTQLLKTPGQRQTLLTGQTDLAELTGSRKPTVLGGK
jgi:hypothetical protein